MRVIAMFRVSTEQQASEGASLDAQERQYYERAGRNGWDTLAAFRGCESATQARTERHVLQQVLACVRETKPDAVYVHEQSRLTRGDELEVATLMRELRDQRVSILVGDAVRDLSSIDERFMVGIQSLVDRAESERIKERVARGKREKALNGLKNSGPAPYGYRNPPVGAPNRGVLQIVQAEAAIVRRIFELAAAGDSTRRIAEQLNAEAIPSPRGGAWGKTTITRVLENIAYTGTHVSGAWRSDPGSRSFKLDLGSDRVVRVDQAHEAIVSQVLWDRVHDRAAPVTAPKPRLLTGLLWMNGHLAHGDSNRRIAFYRGPRGVHGAPWIPVAEADRVVWEAACSVVRSPEMVEAALLHLETLDEVNQGIADQQANRAHLARLETRLDGLITMRADGELTKSEFAEKSDGLRESIAAIKRRLSSMPESRSQDRRHEIMKLIAAARLVVKRSRLSPSDRSKVLRSLASRIDLTAKRKPAKQLRDRRGRLKGVRRPPWLVEEVTLHVGNCGSNRDRCLATAC
ncbi:MAG: recombinase family protein [Planctomycetota bacterium]